MTIWRQVWRSPTGRIGAVLSATVVLFSLLGPAIIAQPPDRIDVIARYQPPSRAHWMGTDQLGRDIAARLAAGGRVALAVSLGAIAIALVVGGLLGVAAAFAAPAAGRTVLIVFDTLGAFPSVILALAVVAVLGPGIDRVVMIVAATLMPQFGRVARGQALQVHESAFIEAARAVGVGRVRLLRRHILPNIAGPLIVLAGMNIPYAITIESGLSFLGIGVPPPRASLGALLNDGYTHLDRSHWPVTFAGLLLAIATLGATLLAETVAERSGAPAGYRTDSRRRNPDLSKRHDSDGHG